MGILKGIALFLFSFVLIGIIIGGVFVFYAMSEGIPFLKDRYEKLERFDDPTISNVIGGAQYD